MKGACAAVSRLSNMIEKDETRVRLAGFLLALVLAYTWVQPFREIYGLEARNALMGREMLENGLSLIPKALGRPYPDYPPLYFWLETIFSMPLGHVTPLSAALPSALSAVGLVAMTFFWGRRIDSVTGWLSALILATMPPFWLQAGRATVDMLLAFNVAAALSCFYLRDSSSRSSQKTAYAVVAAIFLVLAFLTKGPIGIVLPGVSWGGYLLWEGRWRELPGFVVFIFAIALMCVGIEWAIVYHAGGQHMVYDVVRTQVTGRIGSMRNKPFLYYIIPLLEIGGLWWLLIVTGSLRSRKTPPENQRYSVLRQLTNRHAVIRLMITWGVGTLAVFTIASTQKARYLLPLYPAVAVFIAAWVKHFSANSRMYTSPVWGTSINAFAMALLLTAVVFCFLYPELIFVPFTYILIWLISAISGWLFVLRRINAKYYLACAILHLLFVGLIGVELMVIPAVSRRASGKAFVKAAESQVNPRLPVVVYGIRPDGDGVKYALHSNRKPSSIRFVNTMYALASIAPPYLFITELPGDAALQNLLVLKNYHFVAEGNIRSHQLAAYQVDVEG